MKLRKIAAAITVIGCAAPAFATNGMNMEGYGPVATGMGGASMAYDNGTAGMINNPATLGFMKSGTSRLDAAIGGLHPDVTSNAQGSSATAFYMPAIGYVRKDGSLSWGAGMMAQGGMGTQYSNSSMFGGLANFTGAGGAVADPGLRNKSEVGVGRLIFPLAYEMNDGLTIGGSIDYVWAGMDLQWLMDGAHFGNALPGQSQAFGAAKGTLVDNFQTAFNPAANPCGAGAACFDDVNWGYFNFNSDSKFSQKAKGSGWAANIGFALKVNPKLTIGGVYHPKTSISDLKTGTNDATVTFNAHLTAAGAGAFGLAGGAQNAPVPLTGQIIVRNFQWPETYGIGMSYLASDRWQFAADYKIIKWAEVMKNFTMTFLASGTQASAPVTGFFGGTRLDFTYYQNWKNQNALMLGAAYKYSDTLTLRFGANIASNPIPDAYVTPLFPAIMKSHLTFGAGYAFDKTSSVDFSLVHAPKVTVTNNWSSVGAALGATNQSISMSQTNWQLMYSHRF